MIQDCKGSLTWIANDPVKKLWNGNGAVYKVKEKGNLFVLPSKEKGRRTLDHRLISVSYTHLTLPTIYSV